MEPEVQPNEISFFKAILSDFLQEYHPHLIDDTLLIDSRSNVSEELFENLVLGGMNHVIAYEQALQELYAGLEFSLYSFLMDIIDEEFTQIPAGKRRDLVFALLPVCEEIISSYNEAGLMSNEIGHWAVQMELTGLIGQYLEENGI